MLTVAIPKRNKLQNIIVLTPKDGDYLFYNCQTPEYIKKTERCRSNTHSLRESFHRNNNKKFLTFEKIGL